MRFRAGALLVGMAVSVFFALPAQAAGITIGLSDGVDEVVTAGGQISYTITITNGPGKLKDLTVTLTLPSYATVTNSDKGRVKNGTASWKKQSIAANTTWTKRVEVTIGEIPDDAVRIMSTASVSAANGTVLVASTDADRIRGRTDPTPTIAAAAPHTSTESAGSSLGAATAAFAGRNIWLVGATVAILGGVATLIVIRVLRRRARR